MNPKGCHNNINAGLMVAITSKLSKNHRVMLVSGFKLKQAKIKANAIVEYSY